MSLKVSRILHAGYVFECAGTQIAFDPIFENPFSKNCYAFPGIQFDLQGIRDLRFAAVFISHYHDDHCSLESLNLLDRQTPIYLFCLHEELFSWIRELGFQKVYPLSLHVSVKIGGFEVTPWRALDADVDSIFQISAGGVNVLNVVDSWIDDDILARLARKGPWDLILWPFQTMRELEVLSPSRAEPAIRTLPPEWREQLQVLKPKCVVPSSCQFIHESWSWYRQAFFPISYRQFEKEITEVLPHSKVLRLNPSASVVLHDGTLENSSALKWIHPVGEQNVDYAYSENVEAPSTAEIAQHFPPLAPEATERILRYCRKELPEKYQSLEPSTEAYFEKPRLWRLALYDHQGEARRFYYRLDQNHIEEIAETEEPYDWSTEVPAFKLYAALEHGESLTSMYLRVNDDLTGEELDSVEILEDPLIRCLFHGVFGAYQKAQLQTILAAKDSPKPGSS